MIFRGLSISFDPIGGGGEPAAAAEPTLEQQLESLKPTGHESAGAKPAAAEGETAPAKEDPPAASPEGSSEEDPLKRLEKIKDDPTPVEENKNTLSPEQQEILEVIPDAKTLEQLGQVTQGYTQFTRAFEAGNFDLVESMFEKWNPQAFDAFLEHVYTKKVASGEWVDRWIADKNGDPNVNKGMKALQREIQSLKSRLQNRDSQAQLEQSQAQQQQVTRQYVSHIDGLFDQIKFSPADRKWVAADINNRVADNEVVRKAILSGNIAAVNRIFKDAVTEYVQRDRANASASAGARKQQEAKKALPTGGSITQENALPDNVKEVPRGKEDDWMDQQFAKLKAKVGR